MLELQRKTEFKGTRNTHVNIDDTAIDLYDTPDNVQKKIDSAMNVQVFKADYALTEQKLDELRAKNLQPNEVSRSVFTSTLEHFITNVGL